MKIRPSACAFLAALAALSQLNATPAPDFELMKNAPEILRIEVLSVKAERVSTDSTLKIHLEAKVIDITRSRSELHPGQSIVIEYLTTPPDQSSRLGSCTTPAMPVLAKGKQYPARLQKIGDGTYAPIATWAAFQF